MRGSGLDFYLRILGIFCAAVSSYIHLVLGYRVGFGSLLGLSLFLAGLVFLAGIFLEFKEYLKGFMYLLGILFIFIQILAWYWINGISLELIPFGLSSYDLYDKLAQLVLVFVLLKLYLADEKDNK